MASLGDMFVTVGAKIEGFEAAMGTVAQRLRLIDKDVNTTFAAFDKIGAKLTTIGSAMTAGITLPLAGVGIGAAKMATDFDLAMRKVTSLLGGDTTVAFKKLSEQTLALSTEMGVDAVKASEALYEAISAGVPKDNAIDFLRVASKAAIAGVTDTKVAVDALTTVIAAYGLKTDDAKSVSDAMFQAVNIGKMQFADLAKAIGPAAQQAFNLGISYQELLASTATLSITSGGVSIAVTQIESAMRALLDPSKAMSAAFTQLGVQSGTELIQKYGGLEGALQALRGTTGSSAQAFNALFGRIEGANAGLGLTGEKAAKAGIDLESMKHATDGLGAAQVAYNEINKSTARQAEMAWTQFKNIGIELGIVLLPAINSLLKAAQPLIAMLGEVVKAFAALDPGVQTTIIGFAAALASIGPLTYAFGTVLTATSGVAKAFVSLAGISGMGAIMPALAQLPGMFTNVVVAVQSNLTGALTAGEAMMLRFGQAALLAAAAFAGWKLGEWAYSNIPGVSMLGDAISDLALKVPLLNTVIYSVTGLGAAQKGAAEAGDILQRATTRLEAELAKKGITVDKTGKTFDQYRIALITASAEANKGSQAHGEMRTAIDEAKKQILEAEAKAKVYAAAHRELGGTVKQTAADHKLAKQAIKEFQDGIPVVIIQEYERKIKNLKLEIARSTVEMYIAKQAGKDWDSQLDANIESAIALSAEMGKAASTEIPKYVEGIETIAPAATAATTATKGLFDGLGKDLSTIFQRTAADIASSLFDGDLSIGTKFKNMMKDMGTAVLQMFIAPATKAIGDFIGTTIQDLLSGKGLGGVLEGIKGIGSAIGGIFRGGDGAAAGATADVFGNGGAIGVGAKIPGTSGAGVAGQVAGMGVSAVAGIVTGAVSAISGVIGNFQFAHMNTALGLIEESTRYVKIWTGEQSQNMLWCLQTMTERSGYIVTTLDAMGAYASESLAWLQRIGAAVEGNASGGGMALTTGGVTLNINNPVFNSRDDIDYLIEQIGVRMRETGQTI